MTGNSWDRRIWNSTGGEIGNSWGGRIGNSWDRWFRNSWMLGLGIQLGWLDSEKEFGYRGIQILFRL